MKKVGEMFGLPVYSSDHVPKGRVYIVGEHPNEVLVKNVSEEIPPPGLLKRLNRWLWAHWK
jgi:hypothetical protein